MKAKILLLLLLVAGGVAIYQWKFAPHADTKHATSAAQTERKVRYYQSAMHPWIKSDHPGKCPICGMTLAAIYEGDSDFGADTNMVVLNSNSITAINVRTATIARQPLKRSFHVIGSIQKNSSTAAWFVFTVYERDLPWIRPGQKLEVKLPSVPNRVYPAEIQRFGTETFADRDFDPQTTATRLRAKILQPPVEIPGYEGKAYFNGLVGEADIVVELPEVLVVPRSAVISPGRLARAFVESGGGGYEIRNLKLGRIGDDYAEVISGLEEDDKVVTHGGLLLDAEAQLKRGE